jgi:hypothetical protein
MKVTGWKGTGTLGVRVGAKNASEYFSKHWGSVHINVDGQIRTFELREAFWKTCPELRGGIIQKWLLENSLAPWPKGKPPVLELFPLGGQLFRLSTSKQDESLR